MDLHKEFNTKMPCVVRNKNTNHIYQWKGGDKWRNLTTGNEGTATKEQAKQSFIIPLGLNRMCLENEHIIELISTLELAIEK